MGPTGHPKMSVTDYRTKLRDIPEQRRYQDMALFAPEVRQSMLLSEVGKYLPADII